MLTSISSIQYTSSWNCLNVIRDYFVCLLQNQCNVKSWSNQTYFSGRDHPFKTSACLRGGGGSPLPMFADARGPGVLGLPTSAFNPQKVAVKVTIFIQLLSFILEIILYHTNKKKTPFV